MTNYLDLDSVASEAEFVLKLNGREHKLKVATVNTFVQNMKDLEGLSMNATAGEELEVAVKIVQRAFPTIPEDELRELSVLQVKAISDYAMQANGEKTEGVKQDEVGNELKES